MKVERQAVAVAFQMDLGAEPAAGTAKYRICCPLLRRPPRCGRAL
jgi:hypothetical protein